MLNTLDESAIGVVDRLLADREIGFVRQAGFEMPHRQLLADIRAAAVGGMWSARTVASVSRVLEKHGLLTRDESLWLASTGRPWSDE